VLLVVPALLAIGRDLARPWAALRRGWRVPGAALVLRGAAAGLALWFAVTLGPVLLTGGLPEALAVLPLSPLAGALALFVTGAAVLLALLAAGIALLPGSVLRRS
jgi:hypothetical protein